MKKQLAFLAAFGAASLGSLAQQDGTIIRADFLNSTGGTGALNDTQKGLAVNLPGGNWIWAKGWSWAPPGIEWNYEFSNSNEGAATGIPLASAGSYDKPSLILIHADTWISGNGGVSFWSEMTPLASGATDLTSNDGATGIQIDASAGRVSVLENGVLGSSALITPAGRYVLDYAVNTASGELMNVIVNGELVDISSSAFTSAATEFVGFITRGGGRVTAREFGVSSPELAGLPWVGSKSIADITPTSVALGGSVGSAGVAPFTVSLCYGITDGGTDDPELWDEEVVLGNVNSLGAFTYNLNELDANTHYFFRFRIVDSAGNECWSANAHEFLTLGAGVLGEVSYKITPAAVTFTAEVVQPGFESMLSLNWGTAPGVFNNTISTNDFEAGTHTFEVTNLNKFDICHYEVVLSSAFGAVTNSGSFEVLYTFVWQGGNGGMWSDNNNWDIGVTPNSPGDIVSIVNPEDALDITGMGYATIGRLDVRYGESWDQRTRVFASDGSRIVFKNSGDAVISYNKGGGTSTLHLEVPLVLESPVSVQASGGYVTLAAPVSGDNPIIIDSGRFAFFADAGETLEFNHPVIHAPDSQGLLYKRGAGEVVFSDAAYNLRIGADWSDGNDFIQGGGVFTLSNTVLTNINAYGRGQLFGNAGNTWRIVNGAKYVSPVGGGTCFFYSGNSVIVSGAGSEAHFPDMSFNYNANTFSNTFSVADGGIVFIRAGNFSGNGVENKICVAGAAAPAALNLGGHNLNITGATNTVTIAAGGVITNGNISVTGAGSSLRLAGGEAICGTFTLGAASVLAPVFNADGILPVTANDATFANGCTIAPEVDETAVFGRFPVVTAKALNFDPYEIKFATSDKLSWKLGVVEEGEWNTLYISCYPLSTLLIVR